VVAVAQLLLKRAGHPVAVDGVFGPGTKAAVEAFQEGRLVEDGVIGLNTWSRLREQAPLPIVDCIDIFDPDLDTSERRYLRETGSSPITLGGMGNGVDQAVTDILSRSSNICLLRFHGHGAPGLAGVSEGHGEVFSRSTFLDDHVTMHAMRRLMAAFGGYGSIQFMHCKTGQGAAGAQFLRHVADAAGVPVAAAIDLQYAGSLRETVRFEGRTRTVCPGGASLFNWAQRLPEFVGRSFL